MKQQFLKAGKNYGDLMCDLEKSIQDAWKSEEMYVASDPDAQQSKKYILGMFPYPSGNAHMGHALVYSITDTLARMERFKGHNVLHPLGWDAFGLPAENAAFKNNVHPAAWTKKNIETMRDEQIGPMGFSFDTTKELNTSDPEYYKWTQWLFLKLYEHGLVYKSHELVNWDPVEQTVLANEQVIDGKGWRSGAHIERKKMDQWYVRITDFAEDLWGGIDNLEEWSDAAKAAQRNWIGRSQGVDIYFNVEGTSEQVTSFTTQPELLYGASAIVLSPEHELAPSITAEKYREEVNEYIKNALLKSDVERSMQKEVSGVFTGTYVHHPLTKALIPVYIGDYVLGSEGSGTKICVPGHSDKDLEFAKRNNLQIVNIINEDKLINSHDFNGMGSTEAAKAITTHLVNNTHGKETVRYRLKDWSVGRQRFWGAPIPMLQAENKEWLPVPEEQLPVQLPMNVDFDSNSNRSPLAKMSEFKDVKDKDGNIVAHRETDTLDTFMCSSWYIWRFLDPKRKDAAWSKDDADKWMPVDVYVGGLEHANQHMIYLRFVSHFLHKIGLTPTKEPIKAFLDNGMVQLNGSKMSKSRGNVVRPDDMIAKYGADALHMYALSNGPYNRHFEWNEEGLISKRSFLRKIFTTYETSNVPQGIISLDRQDLEDTWSQNLIKKLDKIAREVDQEVTANRNFHIAIAKTHEMANDIFAHKNEANTENRKRVLGFVLQNYLKILGITAPHISDVLWRETFNMERSLFKEPWINIVPELLAKNKQAISIPFMVNGKKKGDVEINSDDEDKKIIQHAIEGYASSKCKEPFNKTSIARTFVIRDKKTSNVKMINFELKK